LRLTKRSAKERCFAEVSSCDLKASVGMKLAKINNMFVSRRFVYVREAAEILGCFFFVLNTSEVI